MHNRSKAICILGMHRSGTSVVTRAINLLGAYLGEDADLMTHSSDNPEGYWERNDIVNLHDRILAYFKKSWDTAVPLPNNWHKSEEIKPFREELIEMLKKNFSDQRLWAWKDPRTAILLDMWKDVLKELGIELSCVFTVRNPIGVAKSLHKRNDFPYDKSFGIWFNYNITALRKISDIPAVFVLYDNFLKDWESELKQCADSLGIQWPENALELKEKMRSFVRPELCHSSSKSSALKEPVVPRPVIELYELLREVRTSTTLDSIFFEKVENFYKGFSQYERFFHYDIKRFWAFDRQMIEKNRQLTEKDQHITARDQYIQELLTSYSWRITTPFRWLHKKLIVRKGPKKAL